MVASSSNPKTATSQEPTAAAAGSAPRARRKTRWWAYAVLAVAIALLWPAYRYNVSYFRLNGAQTDLANGDMSSAISKLEVEVEARPQSAEAVYWLAVAHRRAGHIEQFKELLQRAKDLGYPGDEIDRQVTLMWLQSGAVSDDLEQKAEQISQGHTNYRGGRLDLYVDEFYEARASGFLANYRLFDAEAVLDRWVATRPESTSARFRRADIREREQNFQAAEREYQEIVEKESGNVEARVAYARLLLLNQKVVEAAAQYQAGLQIAPRDARLQLGLATCDFRGGKGVDVARQRLSNLLTWDLDSADRAKALLLLGEIARVDKKPELVIKYIKEAIQLSKPLDSGPYLTLGSAYASLDQREEAEKCRRISKEIVEINARLLTVGNKITHAPQNAEFRFEQGNIYQELGQMDEAAAWWHMAARLDPQFQAAHEALVAYYVSKGDSERTEYHRRLAEKSAEAAFNKVWLDLLDSNTKSVRSELPKLARYPSLREPVELLTLGLNVVERKDMERSAQGLGRLTNNPKLRMRALTMLAEALYVMGHYNASERAYHEVLAASPQNVVAHRGLQSLYFDLGAYDQMEFHALQVAKIDQTDYRPHRHLAFVRREAETWEAAIADYKESLRRSPHQPTKEEVWLEMADCYIQALKYQEALDILKDARPSAQNSFLEAQCKYATKKVPEAKKLLDESLKDAPDHAPSLLLRSDIALVEDDASAARGFLERAVEAAPFDNSAHQKLSTVLLRLGEKEAAKKAADRAKELLDLHLRFSELNNQASQRPKDILVRRELAALAKQLGREEEAKRWERVVEGMQDDPVPEVQGPTVLLPKDRKPTIQIGPQPPEKKAGAKEKGR